MECSDGGDAEESSELAVDLADVEESSELAADLADVEESSELAADLADVEELSEPAAGEDSSARATPGAMAIAPPTPSATAKAPTRPMYLEYAVGLELAEHEPNHVGRTKARRRLVRTLPV